MKESSGVLVGWRSQDLGNRLVLKLQLVQKSSPHGSRDVHTEFVVMDKNQAVQLGNYLFRVTGQTPPAKPARRLLARIFGF
ncbi:MAG: hypothetical protein P8Y58_01625 [Novosphingobium sp.]